MGTQSKQAGQFIAERILGFLLVFTVFLWRIVDAVETVVVVYV